MRGGRKDRQHLQVVLDIVCPRGHPVGFVAKLLEPHPRAGRYGTGGDVRFVDQPEPTETSGRLRGTCSDCGADAQVSWSRAKDALDLLETQGKHGGKMAG